MAATIWSSAPLRSWPSPSIHTWVTGPGWPRCGASSSSGVPKASRVPETNRHGTSSVGQVLDPQPLGLARRVQRVADQHQPAAGRPSATAIEHMRPPIDRPPSTQRGRARRRSARPARRPPPDPQASSFGARSGARRPSRRYGKSARSTGSGASASSMATSVGWCRPLPAPGNSSSADGVVFGASPRPQPVYSRASRMRRASVRSAMRWAASSMVAAVVGVGLAQQLAEPALDSPRRPGPRPIARVEAEHAEGPLHRVVEGLGRPGVAAARPDRWATNAWSSGPDQRMALRMHVHHRRRGAVAAAARRRTPRRGCAGPARPCPRARTRGPRPRPPAGGRCAAARPGPSGSGGAGAAAGRACPPGAAASAGGGRRTGRGRAPAMWPATMPPSRMPPNPGAG